jgi:hypothetical protein
MIKEFTIFGERNSGTKYLERVLRDNLTINFTKDFGFKHWYIKGLDPRGRSNTTTDNECLKPIDDDSAHNTLFIITVRNPFDWVVAMYKKPYCIKEADTTSLIKFLKSPYIAYEQGRPPDHNESSKTPWHLDPQTNTYFIEESNHIITLRNEKNNHFLSLMNKVRYCAIIRQECLYENIAGMVKMFNLNLRNNCFDLGENYRQPLSYNLNEEEYNFILKELNNPIDHTYYLTGC